MNQNIAKPVLSLGALTALTFSALASSTVITLGNQPTGNTLEVFSSSTDGSLTKITSVATGGNGLGAGLGSQYGISYDADNHILAAINAGSNSVSIFQLVGTTPVLVNTISSGGVRPVSVALKNKILYVLNQGDSNNASSIAGFRVVLGGTAPVESVAKLSAPGYVNPAQIEFSPSGTSLVVTEKGTNKIDVFDINASGNVTKSNYFKSSGATPFGFEFDRQGGLFVSEAQGAAANASTFSSYRRNDSGALVTISPSVATTQTAACWVALTPNGRYAFTTNAASGTVSSFVVAWNDSLRLVGNTMPISGSTPIDAATDGDGKFLYVLLAGANAIQAFRIGSDGTLKATTSIATPSHAGGLVVIN